MLAVSEDRGNGCFSTTFPAKMKSQSLFNNVLVSNTTLNLNSTIKISNHLINH